MASSSPSRTPRAACGTTPGRAAGSPVAPGVDVRRIFDSIAWLYDLGNHLFSAGLDHRWRGRTAAVCDPRPGERVLDLCCGTADLAMALRKREPRASVVGCDFSRPMLVRGWRKLRRARLGRRAALVAGDALGLPLAGASVDAVVCGFGLRNLADPAAGLEEMVRVVRPGGRVVLLEFHRPSGRGLAATLFRLYFRRVLPTLGGWLSRGEAYRYMVASIRAFGPAGATAERMRRAGLADVSIEPLVGGIAAVYAGRRPTTP